MAEFQEVMRQKERMCKAIRHCESCPVGKFKDEKHALYCRDVIINHPEEVEKIIMDWAKKTPSKN